jgi:hypothetical protein
VKARLFLEKRHVCELSLIDLKDFKAGIASEKIKSTMTREQAESYRASLSDQALPATAEKAAPAARKEQKVDSAVAESIATIFAIEKLSPETVETIAGLLDEIGHIKGVRVERSPILEPHN